MKINVFPEAYISSTNNISISNTNNAILCRNVLKKYENEILNNCDGCLFKLTFNENLENDIKWNFVNYVSCIEFTAPDDTAFVSDYVFNDMSSKIYNVLENVTIEPFNPPQAKHITIEIKQELLDLSPNIKDSLESLLINKYRFLKVGQYIPYLDNFIIISDIKPYDICLVNNTDVEVQINVAKTKNQNILSELDTNEGEVINTDCTDSKPDTPPIKLSTQELRNKRIKALDKK